MVLLVRLFGICGWLGMFTALVILAKAKPESSLIDEHFLAQFGYEVSLRRAWDMDLALYIFYLMLMGLGLSLIGFLLHLRRAKREDDGYGLYLIVLGIISLAGIIIYQLMLT
jgi:hypothetical membrane protein